MNPADTGPLWCQRMYQGVWQTPFQCHWQRRVGSRRFGFGCCHMRFTESKLEKGVDIDDDKVVEYVLNANGWEICTLSSLSEHHSLSSLTRFVLNHL